MEQESRKGYNCHIRIRDEGMLVIASIVVGISIFILIYGTKIISFTNVDWLLNRGDLSQHYIGWKFYRNSEWKFPVGLLDNMAYPYKTSVIFTDSIPVFAVLFKLLSPLLPEHFQYFGLWGVMSFALQCLTGTFITRRFIESKITCVLGGCLFTLNPAMIYRMFGHTALASQWLILSSIIVLLYYDELHEKIKKVLTLWFVIGALTAGIHLYLFPVCWIISFGYMIYDYQMTKNRMAWLSPVCFIGGVLLNTFLLGGLSTTASLTGGALGSCGLNLISFINPQGTSEYMLDQPMYPIHYPNETYVYLGVGLLLFIAFAVGYVINRLSHENISGIIRRNKASVITYAVVVTIMLFASIGPVCAFRQKLIYKIPVGGIIETIWGVFPATARLSWVIIYLGIVFAVFCNVKMWSKRSLPVILAFCILLQVTDLFGWLREKHVSFAGEQTYVSQLESLDWKRLYDQIEHVNLPYSMRANYDVADWASDNNMTLNRFYFARQITGPDETYQEKIRKPSENELFLFSPTDEELLQAEELKYFYIVDGYILGSNKELQIMADKMEYDKILELYCR